MLSFFPRGVLDEILNLIESVSEDFPSYYCTLCNLNLLGDEYHYILECTYFTEKRKLYLPKYYLKHVNVFKFQKLMSTKNTKQLVQLGRFVSDILKKF